LITVLMVTFGSDITTTSCFHQGVSNENSYRVFLVFNHNQIMSSSIFADPLGVRQLTQYCAPEKWALFPIGANPFSPYYSTELSVPDTVKLSIDVFVIDHESKSRVLIRHIV